MHANGDILTTLFRNTWNYSGFIMADYLNIQKLYVTRTVQTGVLDKAMYSAATALTAGVDMAFLDPSYGAWRLATALQAQLITPGDIDRAAGNILAAEFAAGLFDGQLPDPAARTNIYR